MERALFLARSAAADAPARIPIVGAVVVSADGVVVGQGAHERAGGAARRSARAERCRGARARRDALLHAGAVLLMSAAPVLVSRALSRPASPAWSRRWRIPIPLVHGRGFAFLREHGVRVSIGVGEAAARSQNQPFVTLTRDRRPFVIAKAAVSADGYIAAEPGRPTRSRLPRPTATRISCEQKSTPSASARARSWPMTRS